MTWCAYKSSLSASLKVQSFANDECVSCITSSLCHIAHPLTLCYCLRAIYRNIQYSTLSPATSLCPVSSLSLLFSPCINRLLRTLAWGGWEQRWTLHLQKHAAVRDVQPYAVICCLSELADITMSSSECCSYVSCKYNVSGSLFFFYTSNTVFWISPFISTFLLFERDHIL